MPVYVREEVTVKPLHPTASMPPIICTPLDCISARIPLALLAIWHNPDTSTEEKRKSFMNPEKLKHSLSETLLYYPVLAGTLSPIQAGGWQIVCNDAGVNLIIAVSDASLTSRGLNSAADYVYPAEIPEGLAPLFPPRSLNPLLSLQITHLSCGSVALGLRGWQSVIDSTAAWHFITHGPLSHVVHPLSRLHMLALSSTRVSTMELAPIRGGDVNPSDSASPDPASGLRSHTWATTPLSDPNTRTTASSTPPAATGGSAAATGGSFRLCVCFLILLVRWASFIIRPLVLHQQQQPGGGSNGGGPALAMEPAPFVPLSDAAASYEAEREEYITAANPPPVFNPANQKPGDLPSFMQSRRPPQSDSTSRCMSSIACVRKCWLKLPLTRASNPVKPMLLECQRRMMRR